ncbi:hypothetical protein J4444_05450 [Candidatus Woesearchaeota archaeon]|nr:hypothetical protein [Candidatus Woesearchaeota archaeon]
MSETILKKLDDLRLACLYTRPELGSLVTEVFPRRDGFYDTFNLSRNAQSTSPAYTQFGILHSKGDLLVFGDEAYRAHERRLAEIARENNDGTKEGLLLTRWIQRMTQVGTDFKGVPYFSVASGIDTTLIMVQNDSGESVYFSQKRSEGKYVVLLKPEPKVIPIQKPVTFVGEEVPQHELTSEDLVFAERQFKMFSSWALDVLTPLPPVESSDRNAKPLILN